ncbi:AGR393Wp [Eremothecium gossypii ATCC 10895]|uniref:AGR393Wp n=1 Tax=Eremothecium gossypii (strain ATCC 10895 / CBS 109.51 / FGSC 9923 / NRRL Y-1056) TaxID=284811 RepID=Q74Z14_EREGS|nr:AGR393Wp [Eremothecium gossypii ATCC 10895]AAS54883.1 AGR393Wp [Eremothecium gossypii ATCC 10895]AEY99215.1 FAGR393Wp [Eremothecium gossypii FDAG1]
MVLPVIAAASITAIAVALRAGVRAWQTYKQLTPLMIAQLNGLRIQAGDVSKFGSKYRTQLPRSVIAQLEQYPGGFYKRMNEVEAMLILQITGDEIKLLDRNMLKKKHRRAMLLNHPDKGGSPYVAMKINEARDVMEQSSLVR